MIRRLLTTIVLMLIGAALAVAGLTYRNRILAIFPWHHASQANASGRKVLYWYSSMNPSFRSDKPGKDQMGMDLVPKYADEDSSGSAASAGPSEKKILYWYDPMHPSYKSDKPGVAPDCGMKLVPKYADDTASTMASGTIKLSPEQQQLIGVRTAEVVRQPLSRTVRTTGHLVADETKIAHIHVKVTGWVQDVYADFVGQLVEKGQPLFTVYSPDLVATEQEYLIALKGESYLGKAPYREISEGATSLLNATRDRLKLWDISDDQITKLEKTGKVQRTLTIYSPVTGYIVDRQAYPQSAVGPDKELYTVADLSDIWVDADIFEYEIPFIRLGQKASMQLSYSPGKTYIGEVTYIYPTVDPQTRTVRVRLEFPNPKVELKPQMFADVSIDVNYGTNLLIPAEAVLDSGNRKTVFLDKGNGYFEPRNIEVGARVDDQFIVLSGLKQGDTVVKSGNFLIDSESSLTAATSDMSSSPTGK